MKALKRMVKRATPPVLRQRVQPRAFRAYCIGLPKSGTTSLTKIFQKNYRASHEMASEEAVELLDRFEDRSLNDPGVHRFLKLRDREFWLEMDSAWFLGSVCGELQRLYPEARFILPLRDVYSWLDSVFNSQMNTWTVARRAKEPEEFRWLDQACRPELFSFSSGDAHLEGLGMHPLESYLSYWSRFLSFIFDTLDPGNLLTLRTFDITTSGPRIAPFLGIPEASIDFSKGHSLQAPQRHNVLQHVDVDFLEDRVEFNCGRLLRTYFPEVTTCPERLLEPRPVESGNGTG